jgi:RNA polymerase sigma-70 factor (ECF subfamily)
MFGKNPTIFEINMEDDLLKKLKNGEEEAYHQLFNAYFSMLVAFALKYLGGLDLAKEVVQNAFVKLFDKRNSLEISSNIKSYLFKMVYNDCLNFLNREKNILRLHNEYALRLDPSQDYIEISEQTELEYKIYTAINKLPPQCQRIIRQSRFEGKKNQVIADELNISIRTVETQISKALKLLKAGINIFF